MFRRLADLAHRRSLRILLATALWAIVAAVVGGPVVGLLSASSDEFDDPASESVIARKQLENAAGATPGTALVVLLDARRDVRSPAVRAQVERLAAEVRRDPAVAQVFSFNETSSPAFVSRNGRETYVTASLRPLAVDKGTNVAARLASRLAGEPGVTLGGALVAGKEIHDQVERDLVRAELIA